jgi:glutamate 5-kinase
MKSKLQAAATAGECGVPMLIAGGRERGILSRLFAGEDAGTLFLPAAKRRISGRKPWILFALAREGVLELDRGAVQALIRDGKSLLPVGIKKVEGDFQAGACVLCRDADGSAVAVGLVNYGVQELQTIAGCRSSDIASRLGYPGKEEIIHRDNLVPLL